MRILTRYLLRLHIAPFFFALSVLTGLLFTNTVARRFPDLAGKGLEISVILQFMLLSLPHILALTLPMAVLVSVLYAFSQLSADNEVSALKASGINLVRLTAPLVFASVLFAGFMLWFNDRVLPETNHELKNLMADVARKSPTFQMKEQVINPVTTLTTRSRFFILPARIDYATNRLWDIVIYDMSGGRNYRTVYADSGRMQFKADRTDMLLELYDGWIHETDSFEPESFQRTNFTEYLMEIKSIGDQFERIEEESRSDREMSFGMLMASADTFLTRLDSVRTNGFAFAQRGVAQALAGPLAEDEFVEDPPSSGIGGENAATRAYYANQVASGEADEVVRRISLEVRMASDQAAGLRERIAQRRVEAHKKFAIPFASIVFVLIGAPLAIRFPRGGVGMVIGFSLAIFGIYYISLIGGETLGDRGMIAPFWGPWGPNVVFFALGIWGLSRIGKETATTRDGGWEDLWQTVRKPFTRLRQLRSTNA